MAVPAIEREIGRHARVARTQHPMPPLVPERRRTSQLRTAIADDACARRSPADTPALVAFGQLMLGCGLLAVWAVLATLSGPAYVAHPLDVARRLADLVLSGAIAPHLFATLRVAGIGFAAGCAAGIWLPLALQTFPRTLSAIEPIVVASAGIPKYAVIPLFVLWFGIDDGPKLWLVGLLVFYPVFIGVLAGVRDVDRRLIQMVRTLGAGPVHVARVVVLPSLAPFLFAALRIAVPRAVSAAIVGEFLVGTQGVGRIIESAREELDTAGVFAGVIIATLLVAAAAAVVSRLERHLLRWRPPAARLSA